ncbi:recombinase family protein [Kitasatospora sp. NPDC091335]|uniref:recombinase family protein n=1 Tax=Kitasatospora sp. NPDC091335 TaxID=3364085 RepID=UPI00381A9B5E
MTDRPSRPPRPARPALYLRCYPADAAGLDYQRSVLEHLARQRGLPVPSAFLDDGVRSADPRPALERLLERAGQGWVNVVLVPGPFVFSLDDRCARATVRRLEALGCAVLDLPGPGALPLPAPVRTALLAEPRRRRPLRARTA